MLSPLITLIQPELLNSSQLKAGSQAGTGGLLLAVTLRVLSWPLLSGSCWYEVFGVASQSAGLTEPSDRAVRLPGSRASERRGRRRRGRRGCWEKAKEVVGRTQRQGEA